jgi:hypothetical protein
VFTIKRLFPFLLLSLLCAPIIHAQSPELSLSLRRDWGYGGFGGQIQGRFTFKVDGPDNLTEVTFYIDDQAVGTDTEAPWGYQFQTDDYDLGVHDLYAVGQTSSGQELQSNVLTREFVAASQGWTTALKIIIPILGLVLLAGFVSWWLERRRGITRGHYGFQGGAICPKCGYPFSRHLWAPNLGAGKYDRCPNCGKWNMVRRASSQELATAEVTFFDEDEADVRETGMTEEETLRKRLEDSRFDDS